MAVDQKTLIGRKVGRYQIQSVLGMGAMGVVYGAHDPQLDRDVAVKMIHMPAGLNACQRDKRIQSLLNEARLAARLNHPGIVKVYDAGEQEGEPYIVLEQVEGRTLTDVLDGYGVMPPECALPMIQEILEAIAYAHDQGLVHRDLKPANMMVHSDGHVRIMDFGIAQLAHDIKTPDSKIAGTPRYMSPEQITGRAVDMRSDVFALGVIFYELLSGKKPFPQQDLGELSRAICEMAPTPLQALATGKIPAAVFSLIGRAMAKKPEERFPTARQMLDALAAARATGEASPGEAAPESAANKEIIDYILQKIARQGDFPTTMQYISSITNTVRKETSSATSIAQEILKDFALTNRILRMVNSPFYSGARRSITTISRAVVILGIDSVLDMAAGLGIFEHFHNRCDIPKLKAQTVRALMTAIHAREIAGQIGYKDSEEAFICGMMHHLGRLIVTFYFPEEFAAIEQMVIKGLMDENAAVRKVMRVTYMELGEAIAQSWHLPEAVMKCCRGLDPKHKGALRTPEQKLQGIVSLASELSKATMIPQEGRRQAAQAAILRQFEGIIDLNPHQVGRVVENSIRNAWDISHSLRVNLKDLGVADSLIAAASRQDQTQGPWEGGSITHEDSPSQVLEDPLDDTAAPEEGSEAQRQEFLMKTIGEITSMLMGTYQLNDVLMMVLEGMYRGVGSQHVILALVNPSRTHLAYRFGLGPHTDEIKQIFHLPLGPGGGLPAQCILSSQEIFANNVISEGKRGILPDPLQNLLRAQSIVLLPIVIKDQAIGLFQLDRAPEQKPISKHELLNLRTLANQAVLAIRQCQIRR